MILKDNPLHPLDQRYLPISNGIIASNIKIVLNIPNSSFYPLGIKEIKLLGPSPLQRY